MGQGTLYKAAIEGDIEFGSIMAGQVAGLVNKEQSSKEIIEEMMTELYKVYKITGENLGLVD